MLRAALVVAAVVGASCLALAADGDLQPPGAGTQPRMRDTGRPLARAEDTPPGDPSVCDRKWRDYSASERCFARFRTAHRSIKPEAFDVCGPPVADPSRECTRRTP